MRDVPLNPSERFERIQLATIYDMCPAATKSRYHRVSSILRLRKVEKAMVRTCNSILRLDLRSRSLPLPSTISTQEARRQNGWPHWS